jgi:hypothetical protein
MWAVVIAGVIAAAGALIGQAMSSMDKDKALALLKQSRDQFGKIDVPKLQQLVLQSLPETELAKIQEDPQYKEQILEADNALENVIDSGGITLADKAALNQMLNRVSQQEAAGRGAITNEMQARGTLDSGAQLAMQLANQQNSANRGAEAGEALAGQAQMRAYNAILDRAKLAGQSSDRDWQRKSQVAAAKDAIARGNAEIANTAAKYNNMLPQQNFANQLAIAQGQAGVNAPLANFYQQQGRDTQNMWTGVGEGAGQAVAASQYGKSPSSDSYIPDVTPDQFKTQEDYLATRKRMDDLRRKAGY